MGLFEMVTMDFLQFAQYLIFIHHLYVLRWYAKRFLHPDVVDAYDYIFIWDEDLDVEHFDAEKYVL